VVSEVLGFAWFCLAACVVWFEIFKKRAVSDSWPFLSAVAVCLFLNGALLLNGALPTLMNAGTLSRRRRWSVGLSAFRSAGNNGSSASFSEVSRRLTRANAGGVGVLARATECRASLTRLQKNRRQVSSQRHPCASAHPAAARFSSLYLAGGDVVQSNMPSKTISSENNRSREFCRL
jgi:hypothetical protein